MPTDRFAARRDKLVRKIKQAEVDALLVTNFTNVRYLTGFSGDDSYLLLGRDVCLIISDSRYTTQIREECPGLELSIRKPGKLMTDAVATFVRRLKPAKLGFESTSTTVAQWQTLTEKLKSLELVPLAGLVEELRAIKDRHEISAIREAISQAEQGYEEWLLSFDPEDSERQCAFDLEHAMRSAGANGASFPPIVAAGARAALPHARPIHAKVSNGDFVLVDWGASNEQGYKSDLTRMVVTGKISPKLEKVYRVVIEAQRRAIKAIRPGVRCCDVDAVARRIIEGSGFGRFAHGLGHGIGLDIHEGPRLGPASADELKPGMVVTVEPGIYLPGWGGVRIEDDVLVTSDGHELLTSVPRDLEESVITSSGSK